MYTMIGKVWLLLLVLVAMVPLAKADSAINIGSGSTIGFYYPTVAGMARVINESDLSTRVHVRFTGASVVNCQGIGQGWLQMGLSQNNIAYYAYHGLGGVFDGKPVTKLRGLAVLYPEAVHLLVRRGSDIDNVSDLRGKRVYIGDSGSGTARDAKNVLAVYGVSADDLGDVVRGSIAKAMSLMRAGRIDAMFYSVGLGSVAIRETMRTMPVRLLSLGPDEISKLRVGFPFYSAFVIPAGTYPGQDEDVGTVALKALLVASSDLSASQVKAFMDTVFAKNLEKFFDYADNDNLDKYFSLDKALDGMTIPLHPGAVRFYREHGITIPAALEPPKS